MRNSRQTTFFGLKIPHNVNQNCCTSDLFLNFLTMQNKNFCCTSNFFFCSKLPLNVGFQKIWEIPHNDTDKNKTLWGIFVKLGQNHHWHQRQRSQRCLQLLQWIQNSNIVRNCRKTNCFLVLNFLTMQDFKSPEKFLAMLD